MPACRAFFVCGMYNEVTADKEFVFALVQKIR